MNFQICVTWLSRVLLAILVLIAAYIGLQPSYNMAHWTPNLQMRSLGFSYEAILAYEHYFQYFMHFFVGLSVSFLLYFSRIYFSGSSSARIICGIVVVILMIIAMELMQLYVGRNVEIIDVVFGFTGMLVAAGALYFANSSLDKTK